MPVLPDYTDLGTRNPRAARGQPSYQASPVGHALQGFGQELGALGGTLSVEQQQRKAELDKTEAFGVQSRLTEFATNWTKQFDERKASVAPGAAGFSDKFTTDYTQSAREFMGTVPVPLRQQVDIKLGSILQSFTPDAQAFQRGESFRYGQEKVTDGLNEKLTRLARDPTQWPQIEKEGIDLINSNPAYSPVQRDEAIRKWTNDQQIARFDINVKLNGVGEAAKLGTTPGGAKQGGYSFGAQDSFKGLQARGFSPVQAAVASGNFQEESSFNTGARGDKNEPGGASHGIMQWREKRYNMLVKFANGDFTDGVQRDVFDPNVQLDYFKWEGEHAAEAGLSPGQIAGWNQFKNATTVAEANAGMRKWIGYATSTESKRANQANAILGGADVKTTGTGSEQTIEPDPGYAKIDYFTRVKMYDDAIKTYQKEFSNQVADYSSYLRSGGAPQEGFDTGTLQQRLGPDTGQKVADQLQQDAAFGTTLNEIKMAPPERVAALVSQAQDALASPTDFQDNAAAYKGITEAVDTRKKAIEADPAGYVIKNDPQVAQAWQNIEPGGQGYAAALKTTADSQASIGVPPDQIAPLLKEHAARAVSIFKNVDLPDEQRLAPLSPIIFGSTDPTKPTTTRDQQQAVFQQLVKAGLPDIAEGAMEAAARGDSGAAQRLFEAVMVDPAKIGKTSSNPKQIMAQIQSDIMDTGEIGDVAYGLSFGNVSNYERAKRDTELMQRSVQLRMVNGVTDLAMAVAAAKKDLFGDRTPINITSPVQASVLLPQGTDASMIGSGLTEAASQFRAALESTGGQLATENIPASDGSRAIVQAATTNSINRVMDTGVFRNVGDGIGLFDPYTSLFVAGADGRPLVMSIDAILRLGATAPTADMVERSNVKKQLESMAPSSDGGY